MLKVVVKPWGGEGRCPLNFVSIFKITFRYIIIFIKLYLTINYMSDNQMVHVKKSASSSLLPP